MSMQNMRKQMLKRNANSIWQYKMRENINALKEHQFNMSIQNVRKHKCLKGTPVQYDNTIIGGSCHKYHFCRDTSFVATKFACRDKTFVVTILQSKNIVVVHGMVIYKIK